MCGSHCSLWAIFPSQLSFDLSEYTANVDGVGTLRVLDAVRTCGLEKTVKFYQASNFWVIVVKMHVLRKICCLAAD